MYIESQQKSRQAEFLDVDYSKVGPYGAVLQADFQKFWIAMAKEWGPSLDQALQNTFDRSGFWFYRLTLLDDMFHVLPADKLMQFWENKFRKTFPWLRPIEEVADPQLVKERNRLLAMIHSVTRSFPRQPEEMRGFSYSAFSEAEIDYLLRNHREIVDMGCGSGYGVESIIKRGGEAVGIDSDKYGLSSTEKFEWTIKLRRQGRLIIDKDSIRQLKKFPNRTLVISSPESGSRFPAEALETFAAVGGKFFVFVPGGFGARLPGNKSRQAKRETISMESLQAWGKNMLKFYYLLSEGWEEVSDPAPPQFVPRSLSKNAWFLQRQGSAASAGFRKVTRIK